MHPITSASILRFAPSPTGYLHIGNARPALINALLALKHGAEFVLRLDDTDRERSTEAFADAIQEDLTWLGVTWDRFERQSARIARYAEVARWVEGTCSLVYPAYESPDELDRKRKLQQTRGLPPVYDRAALKLSPSDRAALEAKGIRPHWRFKLSGATVAWEDGVRGSAHIETSSLSDPVLVRADGTVLYTFASVVDDVDMGVTHIIRGEDHVANTAVSARNLCRFGRGSPRFRASQSHHHDDRGRNVEAQGLAFDPLLSRGGCGADGGRCRRGADGFVGGSESACRTSTRWRRSSIFRNCREP